MQMAKCLNCGGKLAKNETEYCKECLEYFSIVGNQKSSKETKQGYQPRTWCPYCGREFIDFGNTESMCNECYQRHIKGEQIKTTNPKDFDSGDLHLWGPKEKEFTDGTNGKWVWNITAKGVILSLLYLVLFIFVFLLLGIWCFVLFPALIFPIINVLRKQIPYSEWLERKKKK